MAREQYIAGFHAVTGALHRGNVRQMWVLTGREDQRMKDALTLAKSLKVEVLKVDRGSLERLVPGMRHQGIVARAVLPADDLPNLDDIVAEQGQELLILVLDGVQDPHNLGACLRTADAVGAHAVIAPKDRAVGLTPTARKVASGAAETIPFFPVTNLARTLEDLRQKGVWIVGTSGDAEDSLFDAKLSGPLAVVLGGEEKGMRRLTGEHCDLLVRIPMAGQVESLNVSVAAGVCLFEVVRQRGEISEE